MTLLESFIVSLTKFIDVIRYTEKYKTKINNYIVDRWESSQKHNSCDIEKMYILKS